MMGWYDGGPGPGGWILMTLMMLTFWALLVFGILAAYRSLRREDPSSPSGRRDAMRLLDERFASGEIDADQYTQRRDLLRAGR